MPSTRENSTSHSGDNTATIKGRKGTRSTVNVDTNSECDEGIQANIQKTLPQMMGAHNTDLNKSIQEVMLEKIEFLTANMATKEYIDSKLVQFTEQIKGEIKQDIMNEIKTDVKVLCQKECQEVKNEVDELKGEILETDAEQARVIAKVNKLEKAAEQMRERIGSIELDRSLLKKRYNELEQYTRKDSIRVYGLDDKDKAESLDECRLKMVNLLKSKLDMKIEASDISIAHRLGRFSDDYTRPIICKFISRAHKVEAVRKRRHLKGSNIVIKEDLTSENQKRLESVSGQEDVEAAWTSDGKILAKLHNDRILEVKPDTDISNLTQCSYLTSHKRGYGRDRRGYTPEPGRGRGRGRGQHPYSSNGHDSSLPRSDINGGVE